MYFVAMSTDLVVDIKAGVAVLTLNRPEHLNAYTADMGAPLGRAYRDCDEDDNVRAIVVTGADRAFCAGADFSGQRVSRSTPRPRTLPSPHRPSTRPPLNCANR